ncbi:MAG: DUF5592 family protein [Lachnospiraceae bacterium]
MKYIVTKEIKSETKVLWSLYIQDFMFLVVCAALWAITKTKVHESFRFFYALFFIIVSLGMIMPTAGNPKRRNYQAIALFFLRPRVVYKFIGKEVTRNDSTKKERGQKHRRTSSHRKVRP